ncbi:MAG: diaminopimelate decarboxylase [Acetobacteraceae bacterium]|nr:diaminopimelate decarboxylase [Acetobacteraceae bacterium]
MIASRPARSNPDPTGLELIAARPHLSMHAMDGLVMEGVPLTAIADALGTPSWVYSAGILRNRLGMLQAALAGLDAHVHYAVKANGHRAILRLLAAGGAGADVVSEGELLRAREAGIPPSQIVFSGVGKTAREITRALTEDIAQINVESAEELAMLSGLAQAMARVARVALRVNPDVDAGTHEKITTGRAHNKFGISLAEIPSLYAHAAQLPGIRPVGLAVHIGSQILTMRPYTAAYGRVAALLGELRAAGHDVEVVDCGGGIGIGYRGEPEPAPAALAGAIRSTLGRLGLRLIVEPGRWLAGPAGLLLASVVLIKRTPRTRFVVLDAAMNDLVRPAMYDAWHGIVPLGAADAVRPSSAADIVGPVCETGDTFARNRLLPELAPNARVAILDAGAYGSVMSSTYNARPLAAEAMVDGAAWATIRERQPYRALWEYESVPAWQTR